MRLAETGAQSHLDCGDSQSSSSKRKGILTPKMTTVESVTNSDALKKSADTVAKAAFNKSDKGDLINLKQRLSEREA